MLIMAQQSTQSCALQGESDVRTQDRLSITGVTPDFPTPARLLPSAHQIILASLLRGKSFEQWLNPPRRENFETRATKGCLLLTNEQRSIADC
jgi:hypothetical protein